MLGTDRCAELLDAAEAAYCSCLWHCRYHYPAWLGLARCRIAAGDYAEAIEALERADLVLGSRYVPGGAVVDWPLSRRALSRGASRAGPRAPGVSAVMWWR